MTIPRLLLLVCAFLANFLQATPPQTTTYTYQGEIAGVMCSVCSGHVKEALGKLDGVTQVKITLGKEGSLPRLEIISTSPNLTKEAAIKALGSKAEDYQIHSLAVRR